MISTVPTADASLALAHGLKAAGYQGKLVLMAHGPGDEERLRAVAPDMVLAPYAVAADRMIDRICAGQDSPLAESRLEGAR